MPTATAAARKPAAAGRAPSFPDFLAARRALEAAGYVAADRGGFAYCREGERAWLVPAGRPGSGAGWRLQSAG